ncbi:MAG: primosomal protein N' [Prevotellaceae bacterium]|jgi:primosomal protein N' (replication factor Y)|nr:primosomal protein N' [Prevotellaceae bacterium]
MPHFLDVILPLPLPGCFTYILPQKWEGQVQPGCRVMVPFGRKKVYTAIVQRVHADAPVGYEVKEIADLLDTRPVLLPVQLHFWEWLADYYLCTPGDVYKAALPASMKPKGEIDAPTKTVKRRKKHADADNVESWEMPTNGNDRLNPLNEHQQQAYSDIRAAFIQKNVCLLHGVTSSGKTEIYIHLIYETLKQGKQVLYLLPEIALTTQITERLHRVFGTRLGIYHSKFSDNERMDVWQKQLSDAPFDIILGVRSSIFLPFSDLGLVIVDEEHENTYKQQDPAPRYHARNAAIVLASMYHAKVLLGTATPSVESWYNATTGKYALVELKERYQEIQLPEIIPVDIKELQHKKRMNGAFSPLLLRYIHEALDQKEQVILFQNRRGFAPMIECNTCGWVPKCKNCDVSLTYHKGLNQLTCHYCGYTYQLPRRCPACEGSDLCNRGFGTERIEDEVATLFPQARIARMDLDTTRTRTAYERIIDYFTKGKTDILIGTQMVSKGLDFDHVSVVGILNADTMMNFPDFRAYERAFQLMAQVAGRAGRKNKRGRVVLQTKSIDHPIIGQVMRNDYEQMVADQLAERQLFRYPPYYRLVYVYLKHRNEVQLELMANVMAQRLTELFDNRVLGPDKPPVARIQTLFIRKIVVKIEQHGSMVDARRLLRRVQQEMLADDRFKSLMVYYDVDPVG